MSPIDSYDGAGVVFTMGAGTFGTVLGVLIALGLLVYFFTTMVRHENEAYRHMLSHEPVEPGPAVEGEPPVF